MSAILVQSPGPFTTVQDLGREGFGPLGVSPSGAADAISLRIGNRLVENPETAAGLEMTLVGGTFQFPEGAVLALAGSDFGATLDDVPVKLWTSFQARPGQTLRVGPTRGGARCYLCIQGAILVQPLLGSASTHVLTGLGGWQGRALRKGDRIARGHAERALPRNICGGERGQTFFPSKGFARHTGPAERLVSRILAPAALRGYLSRQGGIQSSRHPPGGAPDPGIFQ